MTYMTETLFQEAVEARRWLHAHPETGFDLENTAAFVRKKLDACGIAHTDRYGRCSVCGFTFPLSEGEEPVCPVCGAKGDKLIPQERE